MRRAVTRKRRAFFETIAQLAWRRKANLRVMSSRLYTFGSYRLDGTIRVLTHSGTTVMLPPKTFDLLVAMAESGGRLLSKRELMEALWKDAFVE